LAYTRSAASVLGERAARCHCERWCHRLVKRQQAVCTGRGGQTRKAMTTYSMQPSRILYSSGATAQPSVRGEPHVWQGSYRDAPRNRSTPGDAAERCLQEGETCLAKQASPGQGAHCSAMAAVKCAGASASRLAAPSSCESASSPSHSASGARPGAAAPAAIAAAGWARPSSSPLPDAWITAAPYQALCCI